ncbi:MAG: hypothetical protein HC915_04905 [Anaerolineae bacterium]|nr:hypothetical protein [Anaerolineae bacterium]
MIVEGITETLETMRSLLSSAEWSALHERLMRFVEDYQQKVIIGRPDLQI